MQYPIQFTNANDAVKNEIIQIGTLLYFNGYKFFQEEKNSTIISLHENEKDQLKESFKENYELLKQNSCEYYNSQLQSNSDMIRSSYERMIDELKSQIDDLKTRNNAIENQYHSALSLSGKLDSLLGKKSTIDNAAKGDFGENIVHNQLIHYYPNAVLNDVSGSTAKGDLMWHMNNDTFKALIEVKNVQYVRPSDIQKFERDLRVNIAESSCNCGLFVSLKTETIQSKGKFRFEFFEGIPVIYVSNIYEDMQMLRLAFDMLLNIQTTLMDIPKEEKESSEFKDEFQAFVSMVHSRCNDSLKHVNVMKQNCDQMSNVIRLEEKSIHETASIILQMKKKHNWISLATTVPDKRLDVVQFIQSFYEKHNRFPTAVEVNVVKPGWFRGNNSMNLIRQEVNQLLNLQSHK